MSARPLTLKRERTKLGSRMRTHERIADVLVDHDIAHLDHPFSYGIPHSMLSEIRVGSIVKVPFRDSQETGVVVQIRDDVESVKPIAKLINSWGYSESVLALANEVAQRYATNVMSVLSAVPSRSKMQFTSEQKGDRSEIRRYLQESRSVYSDLSTRLIDRNAATIIIFPSEREARNFSEQLPDVLRLRTIEYFGISSAKVMRDCEDRMRTIRNSIVISSRGGIFAQVANLQEIIIVDEGSKNLWEQRRPYWNCRDVALIRSRLEGIDLTFVGGAPSAELARLIDIGYVAIRRSLRITRRRRLVRFDPDSYIETIREGLKSGVVLVSVAEKSYSSAIICKKCHNRPRCSCGAPLRGRDREHLECSICGEEVSDWRCRECGGRERILLRKGAARLSEELGRAFPRSLVMTSTADKPLSEIPKNGIVIATAGMEPRGIEYSAIALLDGALLVNRPTLRAEEEVRNHWFRLLGLMKEDGLIFLSLPRSHPIAQEILTDNPIRGVMRTLKGRNETRLPPYYRLILLSGENALAIALNLKSEFPDVEVSRSNETGSSVIRVKVDKAQELLNALAALQRFRSASRKELLRIQVDPYDV